MNLKHVHLIPFTHDKDLTLTECWHDMYWNMNYFLFSAIIDKGLPVSPDSIHHYNTVFPVTAVISRIYKYVSIDIK